MRSMLNNYNYESFYGKIRNYFLNLKDSDKKIKNIILLPMKFITNLTYILYPLLLLYVYYYRNQDLIYFILVPGLSFILVTLIRKIFNSSRPYEKYNIKPLVLYPKKGQSMPSRHVFSITVISMCTLILSKPLGILMLILSLTLAILRVIAGIHFIKDVFVGFIIGIISGLILFSLY